MSFQTISPETRSLYNYYISRLREGGSGSKRSGIEIGKTKPIMTDIRMRKRGEEEEELGELNKEVPIYDYWSFYNNDPEGELWMIVFLLI